MLIWQLFSLLYTFCSLSYFSVFKVSIVVFSKTQNKLKLSQKPLSGIHLSEENNNGKNNILCCKHYNFLTAGFNQIGSPVSRIVTGTCAHLNGKDLLLCFCDYLLSHVFAAIQQILRGGYHRFQANQPETNKIFSYFSCVSWDLIL